MNIPHKIIEVIKELYRRPTFNVEMEGRQSEWTPQRTGIRQGCPLSPYLFITLMTCLMHDVHQGDHLNLEAQRVLGTQADEVLYADDTICITQDENAMNRLVNEIEVEGAYYGLKLNRGKCEYLSFGNARAVYYADGSPIPRRKK